MELQSVLLIILAIFIAYFVFLYFTQNKDVPAKDAMMASAAPILPTPSVEMAHMHPAEQQPPQQRHVPTDAEMVGEEGPLDPYAEDQEHAEMPERMRKPERMFRPAPENDGVPANSGIMGAPHAGAAGYASEMVQNEGEFMPGIFAFDTSSEGGNFSMF
jgi:hypothetical protein